MEDGPVRQRHARLAGAVLSGLALFALGLCVVLPGKAVAPVELAALAGSGLLAVLALLAIAIPVPERLAAALALAAGAGAAWGVCLFGGGFASPLALALFALPLEAAMVGRGGGALLAGVAAAVAAGIALAGAGAPAAGETLAHPAAWLPVLAWGATLGLRAWRLDDRERRGAAEPAPADADTVTLRFDPSGEVADASASARAVLGLAPELLLGGGLFERLHVADRVEFLCAAGDMKHGAEARRVELRVRLPRGAAGEPPVFRSFSLDLSRTGTAACPFTGRLRDISAVQDLRDALREAREAEQRAAAERMQLLATLGHELRTPLNAILGFSGLLGSDALGASRDARRKEYAGLIQGCGEHLLAVIDAMLDLGRLHSGARRIEPERFSLGEAAQACRAMMAAQAAAKGVLLDLEAERPDAGAGGETVFADRRVVQQILLNLVSNAVKFTPAGGRVSLRATVAAGRVQLCVGDTGIGIAADDLAKLGTAWTRLDGREAGRPEGNGLGLMIVKELAALHGGTFAVESLRGKGTTVRVTLAEAHAALRGEPASGNSADGEGCHGFRKTA